MAGGKVARISSVVSDIPKPMIKIEDKPVLEHELERLREQGFTDIIITVSHLDNIILDYFGDGYDVLPVTGKPFGVNIEYFVEELPLGNAGALFKMREKLTEDFLLLNADAMFDVDFNRMVDFYRANGGLVTQEFAEKLMAVDPVRGEGRNSRRIWSAGLWQYRWLHMKHCLRPILTM